MGAQSRRRGLTHKKVAAKKLTQKNLTQKYGAKSCCKKPTQEVDAKRWINQWAHKVDAWGLTHKKVDANKLTQKRLTQKDGATS